ncbi:MAG TPA: SRPBCC domain-containing protein [Methylomirabilota bacterium]
MIFEDRFTVRAPIERVWAFLRDAERVAPCVPGVERIEVIDDRRYRVVALASVSFLSLSFAMDVTVTEVDEPRRLVSVAQGIDARLRERVKLTSELGLEAAGPGETIVDYRIELGVVGKLASLGLSVIKGKARQMATAFAGSVRDRLETAG